MKKDVAISVKNLHKFFRLPHEQHSGFKQYLLNMLRGRKNSGYEKQDVLKGLSFDIEKGDFFGIVGRNGSGKSTLLKTLAGIYTPDDGEVAINGTLVPFIELGVGFNPELTGRENIFLNGALLGFSRKEMEAMYDDIVDFAELKKFMDQKLKNYSSGMQVRLAFSIAIRADADILLLDEVLAVGDEAFQRKCFEYFKQLREEKKTVILVSHDMGSVQRFCTKAVLIEKGKIKVAGTPEDVAKQYILDNLTEAESDKESSKRPVKEKNMNVTGNIKSIKVTGRSSKVISNTGHLEFDVTYEYIDNIDNVYLGISIFYKGVPAIEQDTIGAKPYKVSDNTVTYRYKFPLNRFNEGEFEVSAALIDKKDKKLVAFTTNKGNFTFVLRNDGDYIGGLLAERGEWVRDEQ